MRKVITGEQVAQLYNRDPFALPVWRAPVYRTPAGIVLLVQLVRLLAWLVRLIARHPAAATGCRTMSRTIQASSRASWTRAMIPAGVW